MKTAGLFLKERNTNNRQKGRWNWFRQSGKVAEYAAIARKKGDIWYVGAMSNWSARELALDFSFLDADAYEAVIFQDGINADRDATDYKKDVLKISSGDQLTIQLSPGGGWAARVEKIN